MKPCLFKTPFLCIYVEAAAYLDVAVADASAVQVLQPREQAEEELAGQVLRHDALAQRAAEGARVLVVHHGQPALQVLHPMGQGKAKRLV